MAILGKLVADTSYEPASIRDALDIIPAVTRKTFQISKPKKTGWQYTP